MTIIISYDYAHHCKLSKIQVYDVVRRYLFYSFIEITSSDIIFRKVVVVEVVNVIRRDFTWYGFVVISSLLGLGTLFDCGSIREKMVCWYKYYSVCVSDENTLSTTVFTKGIHKETIFLRTHFLIVMSRIPLRFFYFRYIIIKCERIVIKKC